MIPDENEDAEAREAARPDATLERLAVALGTSREALSREKAAGDLTGPANVLLAQEGTVLLRAFNSIADPQVRQRCLAFVLDAAASMSGREDR